MATESRRCERCNGSVPNRMSRTRDEAGLLVCEECRTMKTPDWTAGLRYVAAMGEGPEMERRVAEAISSIARVARAKNAGIRTVAHDSGDNAIINHCPFCGSGAVVGKGTGTVGCDFCHTNFTVQVQPSHPFMPQTVDGQPVPPAGLPGDQPTEMSAPLDPAVNETEEGVVEEATGQTSFNAPKTPSPGDKAPSPGDKPKENPFAKGSSRTAAAQPLCSDCFEREHGYEPDMGDDHSTFEPGVCPRCGLDATVFTFEAVKAPKVSYRTSDGHTLDEDAYIARLALAYADDREPVLDAVRTAHVVKSAADATVTCPRCAGYGNEPDGSDLPCTSCDGTGLVWVAVPGVEAAAGDNPRERTCTNQRCMDYGTVVPDDHEHWGTKTADLLNPDSRIDDNDHDLLAGYDTDWDEDLLAHGLGSDDAPLPFVPGPTAPWLRDERGGFYSGSKARQ